MLIELENLSTLKMESIVSIRNEAGQWIIKMANGYDIQISPTEYEWLMTIGGRLVQIKPDLALSLDSIIMFEPNEDGYMIGWHGEPPVQLTESEGEQLITKLVSIHHHTVLSERIAFLIEQGKSPNVQTLGAEPAEELPAEGGEA